METRSLRRMSHACSSAPLILPASRRPLLVSVKGAASRLRSFLTKAPGPVGVPSVTSQAVRA